MMFVIGRYRSHFSSQTSTRKLMIWETNVNQSMLTVYPPAAETTWFQNGFAKMSINEITKQ